VGHRSAAAHPRPRHHRPLSTQRQQRRRAISSCVSPAATITGWARCGWMESAHQAEGERRARQGGAQQSLYWRRSSTARWNRAGAA
jgi:hypothetical protein